MKGTVYMYKSQVIFTFLEEYSGRIVRVSTLEYSWKKIRRRS